MKHQAHPQVEKRLDALRQRVLAWYREEAERTAVQFETRGDLAAVNFDELVRRAQVLFACEMGELCREEAAPRIDPDSPDYAQLQRTAQALRAAGKDVPDSIKKALEGN